MSLAKQRGRPVGSVQTPRALLKADMREQIRLNRMMRELLSQQIARIKKDLEGTDSMELRLKVIETLTTSLSGQSTALDKTAKHVMAGEEGQEEVGVNLKDLLEGK